MIGLDHFELDDEGNLKIELSRVKAGEAKKILDLIVTMGAMTEEDIIDTDELIVDGEIYRIVKVDEEGEPVEEERPHLESEQPEAPVRDDEAFEPPGAGDIIRLLKKRPMSIREMTKELYGKEFRSWTRGYQAIHLLLNSRKLVDKVKRDWAKRHNTKTHVYRLIGPDEEPSRQPVWMESRERMEKALELVRGGMSIEDAVKDVWGRAPSEIGSVVKKLRERLGVEDKETVEPKKEKIEHKPIDPSLLKESTGGRPGIDREKLRERVISTVSDHYSKYGKGIGTKDLYKKIGVSRNVIQKVLSEIRNDKKLIQAGHKRLWYPVSRDDEQAPDPPSEEPHPGPSESPKSITKQDVLDYIRTNPGSTTGQICSALCGRTIKSDSKEYQRIVNCLHRLVPMLHRESNQSGPGYLYSVKPTPKDAQQTSESLEEKPKGSGELVVEPQEGGKVAGKEFQKEDIKKRVMEVVAGKPLAMSEIVDEVLGRPYESNEERELIENEINELWRSGVIVRTRHGSSLWVYGFEEDLEALEVPEDTRGFF